MSDSDELASISAGFADSLNTMNPNRTLCAQDGYEIIASAFGKKASSKQIRKMSWDDLERLVAAADELFDDHKATAAEIIDSLKAGLQQWSGDARMEDFG